MPSKPKDGVTDLDVREALKLRYPSDAYGVIEEVGNATGFRTNRHIDMIVMSLWPTRGLEIHGIEIKVSRQDFMKELSLPAKAEAIQKYCDRWWVAVGDEKIVHAGDMPPTWGLLALKGKKMKVLIAAPKLEPAALDRKFIAAMFRRASDAQAMIVTQAEVKAYDRGVLHGPEESRVRVAEAQHELKNFKESLDAFEEASGIKIDRWGSYGMTEIGGIVKRLREAQNTHIHRNDAATELDRAASSLERAAAQIRRDLKGEQGQLDAINEWSEQWERDNKDKMLAEQRRRNPASAKSKPRRSRGKRRSRAGSASVASKSKEGE